MLTSEMILFALLALNGLTFSKIEGWSYLEGIYFSVVALLSIGFGDFEPTHTSTKILLFPYVVTGIALLANQVRNKFSM
jgi:potassium channel subfamily K